LAGRPADTPRQSIVLSYINTSRDCTNSQMHAYRPISNGFPPPASSPTHFAACDDSIRNDFSDSRPPITKPLWAPRYLSAQVHSINIHAHVHSDATESWTSCPAPFAPARKPRDMHSSMVGLPSRTASTTSQPRLYSLTPSSTAHGISDVPETTEQTTEGENRLRRKKKRHYTASFKPITLKNHSARAA